MKAKKTSNMFPDPLASSEEKDNDEYGLKVAKAISTEWFNDNIIQEGCNYHSRRDWIEKMRLYSRGQQSLSYFQNLISRQDEDLSYINLDWRPENTAGKFVKIVANGINSDHYMFSVSAIDRLSSDRKTEYRAEVEKRMHSKNLYKNAKEALNIDMANGEFIPRNQEELDIHMSLDYKPKQEIAEELLVNYVFNSNDWYEIEEQSNIDLVECALSVVECFTDTNNGLTLKYRDIKNYIHSFAKNSKSLKDKYYEGFVRTITLSELRAESDFTDKQLRDIIKKYASKNGSKSYSTLRESRNIDVDAYLDYKIDILDYTYKTSKRIAYKKKKNGKKGSKLSKKQSDFNAPKTPKYETLSRTMETWYEGSYIIGSEIVYNWRESENVIHDKLNRVKSRFITRATDIYENQLHSFLSDIIPTIDQIHITKLKLQHIIAEIKPNGAVINLDALANLTEGDKVNHKEVLAIFNAKGIVFEKDYRDENGELVKGAAVRELKNGVPANLMHLLQILQYQNNSLREITGINPARDGTQPSDSLVGIQQAQLMASNTITEHIEKASKHMKLNTAEVISIRIADIFRFKEAKHLQEIYENAIGKLNVDVLKEIGSIHLHEFGFTMELLPTIEELDRFEEVMKISLKSGHIDEFDIAQAREIAKVNPKYATQYLKVRKEANQEEKMKRFAAETQIKSQNDIKSNQAASANRNKEYQFQAMVDIKKQRALAEIEALKQQWLNKVNAPVKSKEYRFDLLKEQLENAATMNLTKYKEDAKDKRQTENNTQHSKMIKQREVNGAPIDFSSEGSFEDLIEQYL